jgi:SOS-response transcriptional repressor LexA
VNSIYIASLLPLIVVSATAPWIRQPSHSTTNNLTGWVRVKNERPDKDMFAIRIVGKSMEPKIPDGSIGLFRGGEALAGSREGRTVLVSLRDDVDPETGGRLTVKVYSSTKALDEEGGFQHTQILLKPLNPNYQPIELTSADEGVMTVLGVFVAIVKQG